MPDLSSSLRDRLVRLQQLDLSLSEVCVESPEASARLTRALEAAMAGLPEHVKLEYERLRRRGLRAVVPLEAGACGGCGLQLPQPFLVNLHRSRSIVSCPHCRRFVYREPPLTRP